MAANPVKQAVEFDECWDCHHDISKYMRNKSSQEQLSFFASLSENFQIHDPLADPNAAIFIGSLYNSFKPQFEENRPACDNDDDDDDDENYKFFLDHSRLDGNSPVLDIPEDGIFVQYEVEEPEDSNIDDRTHLILNSAAGQLRKQKQPLQKIGNRKVPVPLKSIVQPNVDFEVKEEEDDDEDHLPDLRRRIIKQPETVNVDKWWHKAKARARKNTEFRDKLMDDLRRPYSEEEYQMLLTQLGAKKPVQSKRVLRSCTKSYNDNTRPPKSILDYHADLANRIDSVRDDHPRVLNLLRGFFYWITNLSQEGSFLPWEDASCLEVLPQ